MIYFLPLVVLAVVWLVTSKGQQKKVAAGVVFLLLNATVVHHTYFMEDALPAGASSSSSRGEKQAALKRAEHLIGEVRSLAVAEGDDLVDLETAATSASRAQSLLAQEEQLSAPDETADGQGQGIRVEEDGIDVAAASRTPSPLEPEPAIISRAPSLLEPEPAIISRAPSPLGPEPAIISRAPSPLEPELDAIISRAPSPLGPETAIISRAPSPLEPEPAIISRAPSPLEPEPASLAGAGDQRANGAAGAARRELAIVPCGNIAQRRGSLAAGVAVAILLGRAPRLPPNRFSLPFSAPTQRAASSRATGGGAVAGSGGARGGGVVLDSVLDSVLDDDVYDDVYDGAETRGRLGRLFGTGLLGTRHGKLTFAPSPGGSPGGAAGGGGGAGGAAGGVVGDGVGRAAWSEALAGAVAVPIRSSGGGGGRLAPLLAPSGLAELRERLDGDGVEVMFGMMRLLLHARYVSPFPASQMPACALSLGECCLSLPNIIITVALLSHRLSPFLSPSLSLAH